jgi:hypothetical protein
VPAVLAGLVEYAGLALAFLEALAAYLLAVACVYMWIQIMHPIFGGVAHILPGGVKVYGVTVLPDLRNGWRRLEQGIYQGLLDWRRGSEIQIAWTWRQMGDAWGWTAAMVEWLAKETDLTFEALAKIHLPKWAKWIVAGAFPPLLIARLVKALLPHIHVANTKTLRYVEHTITHTVTRVVVKTAAVAIPGAIALPGIRKEIYGLTRRNLRINWRLRRLEALLTVAGIAAMLAKTWGVSLRCVRRNGPIGRVARHLCGLDNWLLDFLLLGAVEAFIATDLCDFSDLLIAETRTIRPVLMEFVGVENALIGCHGNTAPNRLTLPPVSLPALVDAVSLAA